MQGGEHACFGGGIEELVDPGGDVTQEPRGGGVVTQTTKGAQGLGEALRGGNGKFITTLFPVGDAFHVVIQQFIGQCGRQVDVGVAQEGRQVIHGGAEAHTLEINEYGFAPDHEDIT